MFEERNCDRMEEQNHGYFEEALSNFTKDFAYGGAIRHLVDHIIKSTKIEPIFLCMSHKSMGSISNFS